uniref:Uncharacterized protein n=1 Tax=Rhipicephalus zambeziensis TaxID=60191 RepID=A0A224YHF4_9ACAR
MQLRGRRSERLRLNFGQLGLFNVHPMHGFRRHRNAVDPRGISISGLVVSIAQRHRGQATTVGDCSVCCSYCTYYSMFFFFFGSVKMTNYANLNWVVRFVL